MPTTRRRLAFAVFALAGVALLFPASLWTHIPRPVLAAGVLVNTLNDADPPVTDGLCSLREAIINATSDAAVHPDCPAGVGSDALTFNVSGTVVLTAALPTITDGAGLTIDGSGRAVTISGNHNVRPFRIAPTGVLELRALTVVEAFASESSYPFVFGDMGSAIRNDGTLRVVGSTFRLNESRACGRLCGSSGGTIRNVAGTAHITDSLFEDNLGGAVLAEGGGVTLESSILRRNTADFGTGGGVTNRWAVTVVVRSSVESNSGNLINYGTMTVLETTVSDGGAAIQNHGVMTLANTTVSGNNAAGAEGGGIVNSGTLTLLNSTVAGNTAALVGGVYNKMGATATMINSIVAGNTGYYPDCAGVVTTAGPNLIGDTAGCTMVGMLPVTGDPKLMPLGGYGGPTRTHALQPDSPAIDAGDNSVCATAPVDGKDQRGVARPQGGHCDLGSFELEPSVPIVGGRNLRVTTGSIALAWDAGTAQRGYTLLQYNAVTQTAAFAELPADATGYSHASAQAGVLYCYGVAAKGDAGAVLGLSDLVCAMWGIKTGAGAPDAFALSLNQTTTATVSWASPVDRPEMYLLQRLPLDGSPPSQTQISGGAVLWRPTPSAAGECYQLVAYLADAWGSTDVVCGIPGFATLGKRDAASWLAAIQERTTVVSGLLSTAWR